MYNDIVHLWILALLSAILNFWTLCALHKTEKNFSDFAAETTQFAERVIQDLYEIGEDFARIQKLTKQQFSSLEEEIFQTRRSVRDLQEKLPAMKAELTEKIEKFQRFDRKD